MNNSENNSIRFRLIGVDGIQLAVPEDQITTLVNWTEPTPLPFGPKAVLGVVCVQGRMFTVVDLIKLIQQDTNKPVTAGSILVLRGDEQLALAVGSTGQTIELPLASIKPAEPDANNLISGSFEHNGSNWQILNVNELFNSLIQGRERRRRRT